MKKDYNKLSAFQDWIDKTFNWIDPEVKKYMKRAWCARGKVDRQNLSIK